MKILNDNVLHVGDIIVTTATGKMSKGIRGVTNSDISHAMVLIQPISLVDSTMKDVHVAGFAPKGQRATRPFKVSTVWRG